VITYCSNIHPGETFDEIFHNLQTHCLAVKQAVSPDKPFPIGLRLSNRAAFEINEKISLEFKEWFQKQDCFVPTINGFPYGPFGSSPVKEKVYQPDWRSAERVIYTKRLATLLDSWLPDGMKGTISTVPVGFRKLLDSRDYDVIRKNLINVLEHFERLRQKSGKEIILSLEPEPGCLLETVKDVIVFLEQIGISDGLRKSLGVCFDCCHQAVEFEEPSESLRLISEAGVKIGKVQISSALLMKDVRREVLEKFCEPIYLHQVVIRHKDGRLIRYDDLPEALECHRGTPGEEWRVHFHVPIFVDEMQGYGTTRFFIESLLPLLDRGILLEVETYTWHVLPTELQTETVTQSIIREMEWVRSQIDETNGCP